jgi:hypothetical protein
MRLCRIRRAVSSERLPDNHGNDTNRGSE